MSNHPLNIRRTSILVSLVGLLLLFGCSSTPSRTPSSADTHPDLFTIPQDQISHIQVVTVEPTAFPT